LNGAIYIAKVRSLRKEKSFFGNNSYAYIMDKSSSIDIDTIDDLEFAEFIIEKKKKK
jgi:CMP-N-acetylneuraminic acid synthetase